MSAVLVVRQTSLGDIIHALAIVADIRAHRPELAIDWVAEADFAQLVALDPAVRRVIPFGLRRWRHRLAARETWAEFAAFRRALREDDYAAVLDLQEQVKGALITAMSRGIRHGPDRASIREPIATLVHDVHHAIDPNQHLIDRCRQLAAAALEYTLDGPPRYGLVASPDGADDIAPPMPYVALVHGTSQEKKLWPEEEWRNLIRKLRAEGYAVVLPWGNESELARSRRLAEGERDAFVPLPPRRSLPAVASLLARAELTVGVDTGLVHLSAALGTPTVSIFVATEPSACGAAPIGPNARDLGRTGALLTADDVLSAARALRRSAPPD